MCATKGRPLTGEESGGRLQLRATAVAMTDVMLSLGVAGGSLSRVLHVTSGDEGPAPFVLNAWTENVYIVDFLRPATSASSLACASRDSSIVLNV